MKYNAYIKSYLASVCANLADSCNVSASCRGQYTSR